ncbi:hypothetical protein WAI453_007918 [Rhynchosporium graminicola]
MQGQQTAEVMSSTSHTTVLAQLCSVLKTALTHLDKEVEQSKNLRKVSPIRLVAVGGYVSVTYLQNRRAAEDIDYILDPQIEDQVKT